MHSYLYRFSSMPRHRGFSLSSGAPIWLTYLLMFASFALAVTIIVLLILNLTKSRSTTKINAEALQILNKRYANGEIDKDVFEQMKKDLR
jgi:uncharacterized membrane protein